MHVPGLEGTLRRSSPTAKYHDTPRVFGRPCDLMLLMHEHFKRVSDHTADSRRDQEGVLPIHGADRIMQSYTNH